MRKLNKKMIKNMKKVRKMWKNVKKCKDLMQWEKGIKICIALHNCCNNFFACLHFVTSYLHLTTIPACMFQFTWLKHPTTFSMARKTWHMAVPCHILLLSWSSTATCDIFILPIYIYIFIYLFTFCLHNPHSACLSFRVMLGYYEDLQAVSNETFKP